MKPGPESASADGTRLGVWIAGALLAPALLWSGAAVWFDGPASRPLAGLLVSLLFAGTVATLWRVRPARRGLAICGLLFLGVLAWWLSLRPSNEREWLPDVARLPHATIEGDRVTIRNVRNFEYRSVEDFTEHWEERAYDLSKLVGVDVFLSYWGSPWIAHTIVSWAFSDGQHLAISIETRKEVGETYSAVLGFFRHFELYYVVADERDLVGLRTNHRQEDVYVYRMNWPVETARALLVDYLESINGLHEKPRWYNAARYNCTTTIRHHMQHIAAGRPFDWRILVNGRIDELAYERGTIAPHLPFEEVRQQSAISARARALDSGEDFSAGIRRGLPSPPAAR